MTQTPEEMSTPGKEGKEPLSKTGYVLCLVPENHGAWTELIATFAGEDDHAARFGAVPFEAHVTIARQFAFSPDALFHIARKLAKRPCVSVSLGDLTGTPNDFFHAAYIPILPTRRLTALVDRGQKMVGRKPKTDAHISVMYGNMTQHDIDTFIATHTISESLRDMRITQVGVMEAKGAAHRWRMLHTYYLKGAHG